MAGEANRWRPGILKTHDYTSYLVAPSTDNTNAEIDMLIKSFFSVRNDQLFKMAWGDGQPVIAIEVYADHQTAYYLFTVPTQHKLLMKERLEAAFKGGGVREHTLEGWPMQYNQDTTLIANVALTKSPVFPLQFSDASICKDLLYVTEELRENEKAFVQILIEPQADGWQAELESAYEKYLGGEAIPGGGLLKSGGRSLDASISSFAASIGDKDNKHKPKSANNGFVKHRQIPDFHKKIRQSGFNVAVRLVVDAPEYNRRNDIIEGLAGAFKATNYYNAWQMQGIIRKKAAMTALQKRQMPFLQSANLICEDELRGLISLPTKEIKTKRLERMKPDEETVDQRVTRSIIPVGFSIEYGARGTTVGFSIADPDTASKARLWIAPPGSGKSTGVLTFMQGSIAAGHGGSIFDVADGRLYLQAIECTDPRERDKLVLVNFADERYPHVFNFSSLGSDADQIGMMFSEFFEIFFKTASNHRMNSFLQKSSITVFADPNSTFLELILLMRDEDFRRKFLPQIKRSNPDLFLWWKSEFPKIAKSESMMNEILQPIIYRLDNMQYNKRIAPIFCGRGGRLEIAKWMNEGRWILYNISNGIFLETEQRMLMSFLNYAYWSATLSRERLLQGKIEPVIHHKMYDEPQTYMTATPVFELSISKSRKYRVSDNFLIQNPTQVIKRDPALWNQIIGMNPHILVGGGLDNDGLKEMAGILKISKEELAQLESLEYHWYFKTYVGKESLKPFIFNAKGMMPPNHGPAPALKMYWRQALAPKTAEEHREDISARNLKLSLADYRKLLESYDETDDEEGVPIGEDT